MSSPALVFRALQPEIINASIVARAEEVAAYSKRHDGFLSDVGAGTAYGINGYNGSMYILGYNIPTGAELPEGWRRDSKKRNLAVPAKKTPEGKRIASEVLPKLALAGRDIPGAPESASTEGYMLWPSLRSVGAEYFLTFSMVPTKNPIPGLDPEHWAPIKRSEYYAAIEVAGELGLDEKVLA